MFRINWSRCSDSTRCHTQSIYTDVRSPSRSSSIEVRRLGSGISLTFIVFNRKPNFIFFVETTSATSVTAVGRTFSTRADNGGSTIIPRLNWSSELQYRHRRAKTPLPKTHNEDATILFYNNFPLCERTIDVCIQWRYWVSVTIRSRDT